MTNKNIIVSNNGKYEPISASVDSDSGELSSSLRLTVNTASFVEQNGLMEIYGGRLIPIANTSVLNPQSDYSGSLLTYDSSEGFGPARTANAAFSGDISGDTATGIKIRSVNNVTSGTLPSLYGGTGTGSFSVNSLVTTSGSGLMPNNSNKIVASNNNWGLLETSLNNFSPMSNPVAYLYPGSHGSNNLQTWTKPTGCRFVTVICQGGGSAGGSGTRYGGGGGGFSYATFNAIGMPNTITVQGGAGGHWNAGTSGGNSYFGNYIIAYGGTSPNGGVGYIENGGNGGMTIGSKDALPGASTNFAGAGGGGGGLGNAGGNAPGKAGGNVLARSAYGTAGAGTGAANDAAHTVEVFYLIDNLKKVLLNGNTLIDLPPLFSGAGGGGGGGRASSTVPNRFGEGGNAQWGSGGGAHGSYYSSPTMYNGYPGLGGKGYVLIICY